MLRRSLLHLKILTHLLSLLIWELVIFRAFICILEEFESRLLQLVKIALICDSWYVKLRDILISFLKILLGLKFGYTKSGCDIFKIACGLCAQIEIIP